MENQKSDRNRNLWLIGIALMALIVAIFLIEVSKNTDTNINEYKQPVLSRVKTYYDDNNTFQEVVYDPDTMVMYVIIDGKLMSPLFNADGTLKTYKPE